MNGGVLVWPAGYGDSKPQHLTTKMKQQTRRTT
jgi:hypothetical protein